MHARMLQSRPVLQKLICTGRTEARRFRFHGRACHVRATATVPDRLQKQQQVLRKSVPRIVLVTLAAATTLSLLVWGTAAVGAVVANWLYPGGLAVAAFDLWATKNPVVAKIAKLLVMTVFTAMFTFAFLAAEKRVVNWNNARKRQHLLGLTFVEAAKLYNMPITDPLLNALKQMRIHTMATLVKVVKRNPDRFTGMLTKKGVDYIDAAIVVEDVLHLAGL